MALLLRFNESIYDGAKVLSNLRLFRRRRWNPAG
jgi:hypothetical protein